ncbi:MAG TPA: VOC family protein [Sporichthyaceae bacterium]|nr:VOC family protein [Sporichthyaceae bacterium]
MTVQPIPDGYPRLMPYLSIDGAAAAIDFYRSVFGAQERMRMPGPDGKLGHAELAFGESILMLADISPMSPADPRKLGGSPVTVMLYVADVDTTYAAALDAGASGESPPQDQFYGDRSANLVDPWGHRWHISTHVEDVDPEEMNRRMQNLMPGA